MRTNRTQFLLDMFNEKAAELKEKIRKEALIVVEKEFSEKLIKFNFTRLTYKQHGEKRLHSIIGCRDDWEVINDLSKPLEKEIAIKKKELEKLILFGDKDQDLLSKVEQLIKKLGS